MRTNILYDRLKAKCGHCKNRWIRLPMIRLAFLILLLLIFNSCNTHNYQIDGHVMNDSLNGKYIYLQEVSDNRLANLDSALVKDGRFSFRGQIDSAVIRMLNFAHDDLQTMPLVFVLQPGSFKAVIDTFPYMTGSEQNDRLRTYFAQLWYYQDKMTALLNDYQLLSKSGELNDSLNIAFQGRYDSYQNEISHLSYDFSFLNNNSTAGAWVFLQSYKMFSFEQVNTILNDAGPLFMRVPGIDEIVRQQRIEQRVAVGNNYIDFSLPDTLNQPVHVGSLLKDNHWLLLDFWASWCTPCIQKIEILKQLYHNYHGKGLDILGISLDNNRNEWLASLRTVHTPWIQVSDLRGWDCEAAQLYGVQAIPYCILINPKGKIVIKGICDKVLQNELKTLFE